MTSHGDRAGDCKGMRLGTLLRVGCHHKHFMAMGEKGFFKSTDSFSHESVIVSYENTHSTPYCPRRIKRNERSD